MIDNVSKTARRDRRPDIAFDNDKCTCVRMYARVYTYMDVCSYTQQIPR